MRKFSLLALMLCFLATGRIQAAVADSSSTGFTVKLSYTIQAPPDAVYRGFLQKIGDWWNPAHTFSGNSHNLSIEEKPMGCFCEKLPDQGSVRHMEVVYLAPGKTLRMVGAIGPLQPMAVTGTMTVQLAAAGNDTKLDVTYALAGYSATGLNTLAAPVDFVLNEQLTRFKNYLEHGDPAPKPQQ